MRWDRSTLDQYYADGGDQRLRLDHYDYHEMKLIIEIGACDGEFTEKLSDKFPNTLIVAVEPVPSLFRAAQERLQGRENVALTNAGLWTYDGECQMSEDGPASAVVASGGVPVQVYDIATWLLQFGEYSRQEQGPIDLLIMNVEGAEYELLPRLIESDAILSSNDIQIQFHDVDEDSFEKMRTIKKALMETHLPTYMYPFVMENWGLRF